MKVVDQGICYYPITGVKSHDDLESWEITIDFDGVDKVIDITYPLEEGDGEIEIAAAINVAVCPGYLLGFIAEDQVHVVSGIWSGDPEQTYIATTFPIQN